MEVGCAEVGGSAVPSVRCPFGQLLAGPEEASTRCLSDGWTGVILGIFQMERLAVTLWPTGSQGALCAPVSCFRSPWSHGVGDNRLGSTGQTSSLGFHIQRLKYHLFLSVFIFSDWNPFVTSL